MRLDPITLMTLIIKVVMPSKAQSKYKADYRLYEFVVLLRKSSMTTSYA